MKTSLDFSAYIADRTRDFTGREWVFAEIGEWLATPDAPRYFIITGEPGIGKTAIAARLTQIRDLAAVHFCIARQSDTIDPLNFARSVSHQLTQFDSFAQCLLEEQGIHLEVRVDIRENYGQVIAAWIENLVVKAPLASIAFNRAVQDPLKKLYADGFDRQLVILVDALDEAVQHRGPETTVDLLANVRGLPSQVRFVLTSRPEGAALRHFEQLHIPHLVLDAGRKENLQDLQEYVRRQLEASGALQARVAEQAMQPQTFIKRVTDASEGNFLYLVWLLPAIADGTQRFDALEALPKGLDGIYREFLRTRKAGKDIDQWRDRYRTMLGMLVAAREPLRSEQLARLTGLSDQEVNDLLLDVQQFLDPLLAAIGQYRLYHQSIADFLRSKEQAQEFWIDLPAMHQEIAAHYQSQYALRWDKCDLYGLYHLSAHLCLGEQYDLLDELVRNQEWYGAKLSLDLSGRSFVTDVDWAIKAAEAEGKDGLPKVVAYNLLRAKLRERAGKITPELVETLAYLHQGDQVLGYASLISDPKLQARTLCIAARILQNRRQKENAQEALRQALDAAQPARGEDERRWKAIPDWQREVESEKTLSGILMQIIDTMGDLGYVAGLKYALRIVRDLEFRGAHYRPKSELLVSIARNLVRAGDLHSALEVSEQAAQSAEFEVAGKIEDVGIKDRTCVLVAIAEELVNAGDHEEAQRVLDRVWPVLGGDAWALIVSGIARIAVWNRDFGDARRLVDQIDLRYPKERALAWLAEGMIRARLEDATEKALEIAQDLTRPEFKATVLLSVVSARAQTGNVKDLLDLLPWADELDDADMESGRSWFLWWLVHHLANKDAWEDIQRIVDLIENRYWRGRALVDVAEAAYRGGLTDLASHSLDKAATGLPVGELAPWITDGLRRIIVLRCFVASAWAPIDRERGLAVMSVQGLLVPPENLGFLGESGLSGICSPITRALADLGEFDKAAQWAELAGSDRAEALVYLGRSLLGAGCTDRAVSTLLRAAREATRVAGQSSSRMRFSPYDFTAPSPLDRAVWTYVDAVRLVLQEEIGPTYFMACLERADGAGEALPDIGYHVQLLARLEYLVEEMGWSKLASLARTKIAKSIDAIIPSSDAIEEEGRHGPSIRKKYFWPHVLGSWPPRWIVHRYTEFSDDEIAERLKNIDRLVREWLSQEGISVEKRESRRKRVLDELEKRAFTFKLSIYDRNDIACALADRFARFRQYEAALQAAGLARITESQLESNRPHIDPITLARLALVCGRLGDFATCRDCLCYISEYIPEITRAGLFGPMSEAFVYAAKAGACLGSQGLANELRHHLRGLLRDWLQSKRDDEFYHGALSVHYTGAFRHVVPALAALGDVEGLRLALEFARQVFWADDQSVCVAAVARAMATATDSKGLGLVFDVARNFAPEKPQFWIEHWSEIVTALLDARFEVGDYRGVAEIAQWLLTFEPGEDVHFPELEEGYNAPWIVRLLAYTSHLLSGVEPEACERLIEKTVEKISDLEAKLAQEENTWRNEGRDNLALAYLDLAKACAVLQRRKRAMQMLRRANVLIERRRSVGLGFHVSSEQYALLELIELLVDCGKSEEAIPLVADLTDERPLSSALYVIVTRLADEGNLSRADELLDKYAVDLEQWGTHWRLYCEIAEARRHGKVTADWIDRFLKECASTGDFSTRLEFCVMAADVVLAQGDKQGSAQFMEQAVCLIEQSDSLGSEGLKALVSLIGPITQLGDVELSHRVASLAIADQFRPIARLAESDSQSTRHSAHLLMERLTQAMVQLQDVEGLGRILEVVGEIEIEEAQEYSPYRDHRRRLNPLFHTQVYIAVDTLESHLDAAMRFRYQVVVSLAKAFGKLGRVADLRRLAEITVPVSSSSEFIIEVGAYGTIARELFRLEGEKGIADILAVAEDVPEIWKPVLFSNLAWAVHTVTPKVPICGDLLRQGISAIDTALNAIEAAEPLYTMRGPVDKGPEWAAVSNSIAVVGAIAVLVGASVQYEGLFDRAVETASKVQKNDQREETLGFVARVMAHCALFSKAIDLATSITDKGIRDSALAYIAEAQARAGQVRQAIETATLHTDPGKELVFKIGSNLAERTGISLYDKIEDMCQSFYLLGTRNADSFWQCFRAMLPVIEQVGGAALLMDTRERMQQVGNLLLQEAESL